MVAIHVSVRDMTEVDPTMGVLMAEQRRKWLKSKTIIRRPGVAAGPTAPSGSRQGVRRRAQAETVKNHPLVVADPIAVTREATGRLPAHRNCVGPLRHPIPIHSVEDRFSHRSDRSFCGVSAIEILFGVEHPAEQQSRIDR